MTGKAIVFAGQGAQFVGMGKDLADAYPECKALFDSADSVLGYRLSSLCFDGPIEDLTKSNHCQPAIFVASAACYTALRREVGEFTPAGVAGLSLGEWTALWAAGALTFEDAVRVLSARGKFMQEACEATDGSMVSIMGLDEARLRDVATAAGVQVANINSDQQIVLSGERSRIQAAEKLAIEAGARKAVVLNVAGAFHSELMASAAIKIEAFMADISIQPTRMPVLSNVTGQPHGSPDDIRTNMVRQVTGSVQWMACVRWFMSQGVNTYVECGPGKVLAGLIKRIARDSTAASVQDAATLPAAVTAVKS
jgi:[acyl-carrier-protein] S-malonyltransferase